jgi:hypothetical protein
MASNTNIQVASLDFGGIKQNFINYLKTQDTFKDYNFSGSALSTLLDVLAYNTQYNAFYLNMVANEMFLDSALQRSSVVSHAKLLNYVPHSAVGPVALINLRFTGVTTSSFTLPKYTNFLSEAINNVNYNYVTLYDTTVPVTSNTAILNNIEIKQGTVQNYTFTVNSTTNPKYIFEIPDKNIDTSTITVTVQQSVSNSAYQVFNATTNYLELTPTDPVYFLQEAVNGNYQIYFGDGILGQQLSDGNVVKISYVSTKGTAGGLANSFTTMTKFANYSTVTITPYLAATTGEDKESIDSIKFQAPKAFASQGRAVTKNDYITLLQQNNLGITFDAVNVWGGEENNPPVYGQVFIALKPTGAYDLTATQKQLITNQVLVPYGVVTVKPTIVDPDYTYIQLSSNVLFNQSQTSLTPSAIKTGIQQAIYGYAANNLNTFNSTFSSYEVLNTINNYDPSIITSDFGINLQKKFYPVLKSPQTYTLYYNSSLQKGLYQSGVTSTPGMQYVDPANNANIIDGVFIEEIPSATGGVASISIMNPGFNYQYAPTITIVGDGTGATATATVINGSITAVTVTNVGTGYTSAIATVTPASGDTTGTNGALIVSLQGQYGTLRTYYNNTLNTKTILSSNVGVIDYTNGIITLTNFNPYNIDNPLGQLTISAQPTTTIISSTYNRIITIDPYDPAAISVTVNAKTNG